MRRGESLGFGHTPLLTFIHCVRPCLALVVVSFSCCSFSSSSSPSSSSISQESSFKNVLLKRIYLGCPIPIVYPPIDLIQFKNIEYIGDGDDSKTPIILPIRYPLMNALKDVVVSSSVLDDSAVDDSAL